jgi:molybdate transport system substrate-binding protein
MAFTKWVALACVTLSLLRPDYAAAAELQVLTTGAFKPIVQALIPAYERESGNTVALYNDTAGGVLKRIEAGQKFDVAVLTPDAIAGLVKQGVIAPGTGVDVAKVGIGVAVKEGAPKPDISSVAAFKDALLAAKSVAYIDPAAGGSSGIYIAQLLQKLGIAAAIKPKAVLVPGGLVATRLVSGHATLAIHQISEILLVKGVTLVGPLPAALQNYTIYTAGIGAHAANPAAAHAFLTLLTGPKAARLFKAKGMTQAG